MLPMMSQEEFEQLKESIRTEGQHYPIIVSEDLEVLDGHHRFRACLELEIDPDFEVKHFENKLLEKKFVIEANLRRRHLNNFQLVELAVPLLEIETALRNKQQPHKGQKEPAVQTETSVDDSLSEFEPKGKDVEKVAKKAGVSTRILERGKKIIEEASEDDKQKLRDGKTSISKVYRDIVPPKAVVKSEQAPKVSSNDSRVLENKKALVKILQTIIEQDLFCSECGNKLFQCNQCLKTLNELAKDEIQPLKLTTKPQPQPAKTEQNKQIEEPLFEDQEENFKDEFF
jgi:ParB-like chromosome segregation protein Spo0J